MPAGVGSRIGANGDYCRACIFLSSIPSYGNGALRVGLCVVANGHGVFSIGGGIQADANRGVGGNAHPGIGAQGHVVVAGYFHASAVAHGRVVVACHRLARIGAAGNVVLVLGRTVHARLVASCQGTRAHGVGIILCQAGVVLAEVARCIIGGRAKLRHVHGIAVSCARGHTIDLAELTLGGVTHRNCGQGAGGGVNGIGVGAASAAGDIARNTRSRGGH